jgi:UDP-N-acetylmuramate--alanine ligase
VDALAALGMGLRLGHPAGPLLEGLAAFSGSRRRMEAKGEVGGVRVRDSYAHHPVEITADLEAARSLAGGGRLLVCFQPHLVSRTKALGPQMAAALGGADLVVVCDIYVAREDPEEGVSGLQLAAAVPLPEDQVSYAPTLDDAVVQLVGLARRGDLVLTLGAGDVTTVGPRVLAALAAVGENR